MSSIWKKEISLRRAKQEAASEPLEEPGVSPEPATEAATSAPIAAVADDVASLPPTAGDYGWLTDSFDPNEIPADMPAVSAPPVSVPVSAPLPTAEVAQVTPSASPVDAPSLPTVAARAETDEPKVPFWKKEVSFSRGAKAPKEPKSPKEPKAPKEAKQKEPKEPKASKPPIWKRELSFSRTPKESKAVADPAQPKVPKPPIWKRELSFSRGAKATAAAEPKGKQPKGKTLKAPKVKKASNAKGGLIGLKIGASQIAAARVTNNGSPHLIQVARAELPDGVVVGGELRDIETLAETLREMFAKNKLPKRNVRLGIANNRIGVRTFEIAGIDDERQLANAIRFRAQETLPIPLEEAVLDWQVLDEWTDAETGQIVRRVLLVVAYRELVDRYLLACKKAGIRLSGIDLEAFAMLRALNAPVPADAPDPTGAQVVVNVGHDRSTFAVSTGRVCEFTRVLGWGGQNFSVAIARALDMTPSEALPIKHALSLVAAYAPPEGVTVEQMNTARDAVTHELQAFARELVSSLRFYQNQPGSLGIGELVLTGGSAHLPGFAEELHRLIGVPVRVGDPLNRIVLPKKFREPDYSLGSLTVAIGLGIED